MRAPEFHAERQKMMQKCSDYLERPKAGKKVVSLTERRGA